MQFSGSIPANYDRYLGPLMFEPYALDIIQRLQDHSCNSILEIACGTGRVTKHLMHRLSADAGLIATDISEDMLSIAKEKVNDKRIKWNVVDAQELPFEDDMFDTIICQYGVMFFPDKLRAFKEAKRVLQNDGVYIFNTWDALENNPSVEIINKTVHEEFKDEAPDFLEKGPFSFYDQQQIKNLLSEAGFKKIKIDVVPAISKYEDVDGLIKGFTEGSPLAIFFSDKDPGKVQTVKEKTRARLIEKYGNSSDNVHFQALVVEAR